MNIKLECVVIILASVTLLYVIECSIESPNLVFSQQLIVADLKTSFICKKKSSSFSIFNFAIFVVQLCTRDENRWEGFPVTVETVVRITIVTHLWEMQIFEFFFPGEGCTLAC